MYLMEEPMAAAIGAGIQIQEPNGNLIVDIGGGTTEIAVISLGGIVVSQSIKIAGDKLNEEIINYIKQKKGLDIGESTAENLKINIGCAMPLLAEETAVVKGRDIQSGLPKSVKITSSEIQEAMINSINEMLDIVKLTIEKTPPEIIADVMEKGVVLTGGGALIKNIDKLLNIKTGIPVFIAENPLNCVVEGTYKTLENIDKLKSVLINYKRNKFNKWGA